MASSGRTHLSKGLQELVSNARNVKIEAIPCKDCEACNLAKATNVAPAERRTIAHNGPFWGIQVDLFFQTLGYNQHRYLLLVKEEYSGVIYGYTMASKLDSRRILRGSSTKTNYLAIETIY
jgi:hypothetical protein